MGQNNNGNGYPVKVDLKADEQVHLKILRPVKTGKNGKDPYYLYRVVDLGTGEEKSFFAPPDIHNVIQEQKIGEFLLKRVGTNGSSKLELSILGKAPIEPQTDSFREMMRQCIVDAIEIKKSIEGIDLTHEDIRSLSSTMFIARSRACQ